MANPDWELQRAYASIIFPSKGAKRPPVPDTYALKTDSQFGRTVAVAVGIATRRPMSAIVLNMSDDRDHPVRELLIRLAFGQTRTPLPAMTELASRLASSTDQRSKPSLFVVTVDERGESRRLALYVFPEESTYALKRSQHEPTEATLEHLTSFVLESRLRKVARFSGKNIKSHFIGGEVVDLQIGSGPRAVADYWVADFLDAEFAINDEKGTSLVASGLKSAFQSADPAGKQKIMEAAVSLMADSRRVWSMRQVAEQLVPQDVTSAFRSAAPNQETFENKFTLKKDLLRDLINYRVFQLENGVWVSSPFSQIGRAVRVEEDGKKRVLTARGVIQMEKVQRDAKKPKRD